MYDYACLVPPHASDEVTKRFRDGGPDVVGVPMSTSSIAVVHVDRSARETPLEGMGLVHPPVEEVKDLGVPFGHRCRHDGACAAAREA